jgi:hypothetical protein
VSDSVPSTAAPDGTAAVGPAGAEAVEVAVVISTSLGDAGRGSGAAGFLVPFTVTAGAEVVLGFTDEAEGFGSDGADFAEGPTGGLGARVDA